jgi:Co/Zn/Cd efflux system component
MSDCGCEFEPHDEGQKKVLVTLLMINAAMFVAEVVIGVVAQSSGVIADSLDMLADAFVYGIGLYAIGRAAHVKRRSALLSGVCQVGLAALILADVARRAIQGSEPQSWLMMVIAAVALGANAYCLKLLSKHRDGEVHMRASWIFTRSDVIANAGVILAGAFVAATGSRWPDLAVGAIITLIVFRGGLEILRDARRAD